MQRELTQQTGGSGWEWSAVDRALSLERCTALRRGSTIASNWLPRHCPQILSEAVPRLLTCISRRNELTEVLRRWLRGKQRGRTELTRSRLSRPIIFISRPQKRFWRR